MLRLLQSIPPLHPPTSSSSSLNKKKKSIFSSGFRRRDNGNMRCSINGVEKDSEFELDPDKAREALRKLDEQLQSLSKKQVKTPKIRAVDLNKRSSQIKEETTEISGSFLAYLASALLLFTIFYNILFITVIKPSIDGEEPVSASSVVKNMEEGASLQQMSTGPQEKDGA